MHHWQRFSTILCCLLSLVIVSFAGQKIFSLMQSHLFIVSLDAEPFEFYLGIIPYTDLFQCNSYCFLELSQSFCLILRSLIHFELILVQGERQKSTFSLIHVAIQFSQQ
jgi:hypothetical protein